MELTLPVKLPAYPLLVVPLLAPQLKRVMVFQKRHNRQHPKSVWNMVLSDQEILALHQRTNNRNAIIILPLSLFSDEARTFLSGMNISSSPGICVNLTPMLESTGEIQPDMVGSLFDGYCWTRHPDNRLYIGVGKKETQFLMALQPRRAPRVPKYRGKLLSSTYLPGATDEADEADEAE